MRRTIFRYAALFLFAILILGRNAYALDWGGAIGNLTYLEHARQQAEFCEKFRPGTRGKYIQWRKTLLRVEEKSIRTLDDYAVSNNLNTQERAEFISGAKEMVRQKVLSRGDVTRGNCAQFDQDLIFYAKQLKEW